MPNDRTTRTYATHADALWHFMTKVNKTESCWLWERGTNGGYGMYWFRGRNIAAHRFAYEALVGPIPEGLELDHTCRVKRCVNPAHLEPVTHRENILRGANWGCRAHASAPAPNSRLLAENHPILGI